MYGLNDSDLEIIRQAIRLSPNVDEAILFGSRAKGTFLSGSDVDIALKGTNLQETVLKLSIYLNQETLLPYQIDILDYQSIDNDQLIDHIDRIGVSIYKREIKG